LQFFLSRSCLGFRLKGTIEQLNETLERELVHVVHLDQIAENHKEVCTDYREVTVDFSLLVERNLQLFGFLKSRLNLATLCLCLVEVVNELLVLQNVASGLSECHK
jgi:hypothetical protein